jgi:hypothetical protein
MFASKTTLLLAASSILFGVEQARAGDRSWAAVSDDDLETLANAVNLPLWIQFSEAQGIGAIEQLWTEVYSPKDTVGAARDWNVQIVEARGLAAKADEAWKKRWLGLFVEAGKAVGRKNATQFEAALRALDSTPSPHRTAISDNRNYFRAK